MKTRQFVQMILMLSLLMGLAVENVMAQSAVPSEQDFWDTYIDDEYGFSIQYPAAWRIEKSLPSVPALGIRQIRIYFIGPEQATIAVDIWAVDGYTNVLDWFKVTQQPRMTEKTIEGGYPTRTNAVIQDAPSIFFVQPPGEQVPLAYRMYVLNQRRAYLIHYNAFDGGTALGIYEKMLKSFRIAGQSSGYNEIPVMPSPAKYGEMRQPGCTGNGILACIAVYNQGCCGYGAGSNGFPCSREGAADLGNCTWWAAHVWPELGQDIINSPYRGCYSGYNSANASDWLCIAQAEGYSTGHAQEVGAIFWPQPGTHGTGSAGHVASVIQTGASTFRVSEMNWCYTCNREHAYTYLATDMFIYHRVDSTPPTTSRSLSGTAGENGWYTSAVQVTLSASDNSGGSGVKLIQYRIDSGSWHTYSSPFTVSGDGSHTVRYKSQDNAGNWESEKQVSVRIDTTVPTGSLTINDGAMTAPGVLVRIGPSASDATSGIYQMRLRDAGGSWSDWRSFSSCVLWQLPAITGQFHTVEIQFKDRAGNTSTTYNRSIYLDVYPARPASAGYRLARSTWGTAPWDKQSAHYRLQGTVGQPSMIGQLASAGYRLVSGYWSGQGRVGAPHRVYLPLVIRN